MMGVGDSDGEGIGRVGAGDLRPGEQPRDHRMDLRLVRATGADDRLLDQGRRIFADRDAAPRGAEEDDPPRLAELQRRLRIIVDEHFLDPRRLRPVRRDQILQPIMEIDQPLIGGGPGTGSAETPPPRRCASRSPSPCRGGFTMILIGLDPGLTCTGWGVIAAEGNRLSHVANGHIRPGADGDMAGRLVELHDRLHEVIAEYRPSGAGVEEVFVNVNPQSTLKLGQARGVVLLCAARNGIAVGEYSPKVVKKAVVGTGNAEKSQVHAMVARLLPGAKIAGADAADALAVAITHAHHLASARALKGRAA
jgi:crossover junction endodeoxyribonuclease RuvC